MILATLLFTIAGCSRPQHQVHGLSFFNWYIASPMGKSTMSVAYGSIRNDQSVERHLVSVAFSCADSAELHETMAAAGRVSMRRLDAVIIPPFGNVSFEPGHKHVMVFGLKPGADCRAKFTFGADEAAFVVPIKARE